jgi:hypothetical protein
VIAYGLPAGAGDLALQWLDYQRLARTQSLEIYLFLVALGFLAIGVVIGVRVFAPRPPIALRRQPAGRRGAGTERAGAGRCWPELAAGHANKQIAARLNVSPNTVKTTSHVCSRTRGEPPYEAIRKARELGWCLRRKIRVIRPNHPSGDYRRGRFRRMAPPTTTQERQMFPDILKYGLIGGLVVGGIDFTMFTRRRPAHFETGC